MFQTLADKTKALEELQVIYERNFDELLDERDEHMATLNAKSVEIECLIDLRRDDEDLRNAAHQSEVLNLIEKHQQELELLQSEMKRKMEEIPTISDVKTEPSIEISNFKQKFEQVNIQHLFL